MLTKYTPPDAPPTPPKAEAPIAARPSPPPAKAKANPPTGGEQVPIPDARPPAGSGLSPGFQRFLTEAISAAVGAHTLQLQQQMAVANSGLQ
eukprot:6699680-Pyramimonas_sp.AAC.1